VFRAVAVAVLLLLVVPLGLGRIGPTLAGAAAAGVLVAYGLPVPFHFGAVLAVLALLLVVTQVSDTIDDPAPIAD